MASKALPSPEVLRQLLRYEPETGKLFWRERGVEWFEDEARLSARSRAKAWNTRNAGRQANYPGGHGYDTVRVLWRALMAHRVVWMIAMGEVPEEIDHINGIKSDNRIVNLRNVSRAENLKNLPRRSTNKSGVIGIHWSSDRMKWVATGRRDGASKNLGRFVCVGAAIATRRKYEAENGYHPNHGR